MGRYAEGTPLWVRFASSWHPARVVNERDYDMSLVDRSAFSNGADTCVLFYADDSFWMVNSDPTHDECCPLEFLSEKADNPDIREALDVARATIESERDATAEPPPPLAFTAAEKTKMQRYLSELGDDDPDVRAALSLLANDGMDVRDLLVAEGPMAAQHRRRPLESPDGNAATPPPQPAAERSSQSAALPVAGPPPRSPSLPRRPPSPLPAVDRPGRNGPPSSDNGEEGEGDRSDQDEGQTATDLDVACSRRLSPLQSPALKQRLRDAVGDSAVELRRKLALGPEWTVDWLSAIVPVDGLGGTATVPLTRAASCCGIGDEPPLFNPSAHRLLIVPVRLPSRGDDFTAPQGWMEPVAIDGVGSVRMVVHVLGNNTPHDAPRNWSVAASKELAWSSAKVSIPLDVTADIVDSSVQTLQVTVAVDGARRAGIADSGLWFGGLAFVVVRSPPGTALTLARQVHGSRGPVASAASAGDVDATASGEIVSAYCPFSLQRLRVPSRSTCCTHTQCLELESWLASCIRNSLWVCPLCATVTHMETLYIDEAMRAAVNDPAHTEARHFRFHTETSTFEPLLRPRGAGRFSAQSVDCG